MIKKTNGVLPRKYMAYCVLQYLELNNVVAPYNVTVTATNPPYSFTLVNKKGVNIGLVTIKKGRYRITQNDTLLFSGANAQSIANFLERYYFIQKQS